MAGRSIYGLALSDFVRQSPTVNDTDLLLREAVPEDLNALAELMIESYRGTIDDDGETLEDAIAEVQAYISGKRGGGALFHASRLAFAGSQLVGACLAAEWHERQSPLIAYVMTHRAWKNQGVGTQMLRAVIQALHEQGYHQVWAVITNGNVPSERLFEHMGFQKTSLV